MRFVRDPSGLLVPRHHRRARIHRPCELLTGPAFFGAAGVAPRPTTTWNPADKSAEITLSNGNRTATKGTSNALKSARATSGISATDSGYFEVRIDQTGTSNFMLIGVGTASATLASFVGNDANGWGYYQQTGQKYTNNVGTAYGTAYVDADVIGVAFNNGSVWFARNNTWQNSGNPAANTGAAFTGITGTIFPMASLYTGTGGGTQLHIVTARFKTSDFTYSPPSGFLAWGG